MAEISLCMIVRDERETLARCLDSVKEAVDEIIIVDTGSRDETREIALRYTPHVYDFPWKDDFSAARNEAFAHASRDFLMWLDADDVVEDAGILMRFKQERLDDFDVIMAPYHVAFDAHGKPTFTYYRERILRAGMGFRWEGAVHEAIAPRGRIGYAEFVVRHEKLHSGEPGRNLRIYEKLLAQGRSFNPRERFYYGRELASAGRVEEAARQLDSVIDDEAAWIENRIEACAGLADSLDRLGDAGGAMRALCRSLALDRPRPMIACALGSRFLKAGNLPAARFWYEAALSAKENEKSGAFIQRDHTGRIPLLQLCVIHDRLGEQEVACAYNEQAALLCPDDEAVQQNRRYFERLGIRRKEE